MFVAFGALTSDYNLLHRTVTRSALRPDAALQRHVGHALNGHHQRRRPQVHRVVRDQARKGRPLTGNVPLSNIPGPRKEVYLGDFKITGYAIPGHTPGSTGYIFPVKDNGKTRTAAIYGGTVLTPGPILRKEAIVPSAR